ncbi:MAG: hypothetical protein WCO57_11530, partial [Verrucomicrobiota bacterium]
RLFSDQEALNCQYWASRPPANAPPMNRHRQRPTPSLNFRFPLSAFIHPPLSAHSQDVRKMSNTQHSTSNFQLPMIK